ncbi:MAG: AraC family transcriptional regulator [Alphaproteobacteria bacterium]|nr:AraC family transcriptional regulator [Alphaproteobacteria bacterium]
MDLLSDIISRLGPKSTISMGIDAAGDWALDFPPPDGLKFNAVMKGACWLDVPGLDAPIRLAQGDSYLLRPHRGFSLASDLALPRRDSAKTCALARDNVSVINGGGEMFLIGGRFSVAESHFELLFGGLPLVTLFRAGTPEAAVLSWSLDRLAAEIGDPQPGARVLCEHLIHIMLVQVLRVALDRNAESGPGWLRALKDRRLSRAIAALHEAAGERWTIERMARVAGMSRSGFAAHFRQTLGLAPMEYLRHWRMLLAENMLRDGARPIASIAAEVGYESESAFATAFKRVRNMRPREVSLPEAS